jgi:hypothetical protein
VIRVQVSWIKHQVGKIMMRRDGYVKDFALAKLARAEGSATDTANEGGG